MANEMVVFQGKSFSVGLQSMLGSTAFVPAVAGLYITNYIIKDVTNK